MERNISVIKDVNGNQIVIVNDIRFKGKRNIDWDEVEQYLKQYVGEFIEIAESKEIIYFGMIPDLQYQFLMKIMMFCDIMYFMQSW